MPSFFNRKAAKKFRQSLLDFVYKKLSHRYLIEVDCSSGQFKSAKLKDKEYTLYAPNFYTRLQKKGLMHQFFKICWQTVSCWFMLVMLYLPLLYICDLSPSFQTKVTAATNPGNWFESSLTKVSNMLLPDDW